MENPIVLYHYSTIHVLFSRLLSQVGWYSLRSDSNISYSYLPIEIPKKSRWNGWSPDAKPVLDVTDAVPCSFPQAYINLPTGTPGATTHNPNSELQLTNPPTLAGFAQNQNVQLCTFRRNAVQGTKVLHLQPYSLQFISGCLDLGILSGQFL